MVKLSNTFDRGRERGAGHAAAKKSAAWLPEQELERRRHLLRLWVSPGNERPLPEAYAELYGSVTVGNRGGIRVPGYSLTIPLEAE